MGATRVAAPLPSEPVPSKSRAAVDRQSRPSRRSVNTSAGPVPHPRSGSRAHASAYARAYSVSSMSPWWL